MRGDPGRGSSQHAAADVGRESLSSSAQMYGVDARQIVAPKSELRHRGESREEDANAEHFQAVRRHVEEHDGDNYNAGDQEQAQQATPAHDDERQRRQYDASG